MQFYHYDCGNYKDAGWGCCYRSYQNAMLLHGVQIDMTSLVDLFGEGNWIEPAMLKSLIPQSYQYISLLWYQKPEALRSMKFTKPEDYDILMTKHEIINKLRQLAKTSTFVVDNGLFAYCLFYSNGWIVLDPHTTKQEHVLIKIHSLFEWLQKSNLWMILAIEPDQSSNNTGS